MQIERKMHRLFLELKNCAVHFFTYFYCYHHFNDYKVLLLVITICCRLYLPVTSHLHNSVAGKHNLFSFSFYRYYWNYKIALLVAAILVLINWRTGNTKTPILLYTMRYPRFFWSEALIWMNSLYTRCNICM